MSVLHKISPIISAIALTIAVAQNIAVLAALMGVCLGINIMYLKYNR